MAIGNADATQNASWYRSGVLDMFTSNMPKVNEYGVEELVQNFPHSPSPAPSGGTTTTAPTAPFVSGSGFGASNPAAGYYGAAAPNKPVPWTMIAAGAGALVLVAAVAMKMKKKKR